MMLSDWYGNSFDILQAPYVPYGFIQYLFYRSILEAKDKALAKQREDLAQANAMSGSRGRRVM